PALLTLPLHDALPIWARRSGERAPEPETRSGRVNRDDREDRDIEPGVLQVQVSWEPGRVVAWAAGRNVAPASLDELANMLAAARSEEHTSELQSPDHL